MPLKCTCLRNPAPSSYRVSCPYPSKIHPFHPNLSSVPSHNADFMQGRSIIRPHGTMAYPRPPPFVVPRSKGTASTISSLRTCMNRHSHLPTPSPSQPTLLGFCSGHLIANTPTNRRARRTRTRTGLFDASNLNSPWTITADPQALPRKPHTEMNAGLRATRTFHIA
ncbi:hypothetical protein VUR80DRAFT_2067 [Thermomyces stellatus]